jgi:hypothetical protein
MLGTNTGKALKNKTRLSQGASSFNDAIREVGEQLQMVGGGAKR